MKEKCSKCDGSSLIPFIKEGKVIPYSFVDCECREDDISLSHPTRPDDFDFPVSWDFHRFISERYGHGDPGSNEPEIKEQPEPIETIVKHVYVHDMASMRQIRKLYNLESQVIALKKILNERFDKIGEYTIE